MAKLRSPLKQKILLLLAAGVTLSLSRSPRAHWHILRSLPKAFKNIDRQHLYRVLREFRRERLVSYRERPDGYIDIVLSEGGKRFTLSFDIDRLKIKSPAKWDGYWRLVIFDIPEKKRRARDALRHKLRGLGFYEWQKSVFVFPYPCRDEIDFIVEFFEIRPYVRYAEFIKPTNEAELKSHFNL